VYGRIENLHEIIIFENKQNYILESLNPRFSNDGEKWEEFNSDSISYKNSPITIPIFPFQKQTEKFSKFITASYKNAIFIETTSWEKVATEILEQKNPPAELELAVNSMEHWHSKNLRLAVLESVIGLGIVMASFLRAYLTYRKEIPEAQLKDFLSPEFGLTSRLSGLLNMTFNKKDLENINIDLIKKLSHGETKLFMLQEICLIVSKTSMCVMELML
jgi:hypothetical protein